MKEKEDQNNFVDKIAKLNENSQFTGQFKLPELSELGDLNKYQKIVFDLIKDAKIHNKPISKRRKRKRHR